MVLKRPRGKRGGKKNKKKTAVNEEKRPHVQAHNKHDGKKRPVNDSIPRKNQGHEPSNHNGQKQPQALGSSGKKRQGDQQPFSKSAKKVKREGESQERGPKPEPTQTLPNLLPPDWGSLALPKFKRAIVEDYQDGSEAQITDPRLPSSARGYLASRKINSLTPVQSKTWPAVLSGKNTLGIAPTGSGKTLAYLIPVACLIATNAAALRHGKGATCEPLAVVLAPTRELVQQVGHVARGMHKELGVAVACVYGGVDKEGQRRMLTREVWRPAEMPTLVNLLIATPGRLLDLLGDAAPALSLRHTICCVLDEADRMLALGFAEQISLISSQIRPDRQTLLFSATLPSKLRAAAKEWLPQPVVEVSISDLSADQLDVTDEDALAVSKSVDHEVHVCAPHKRPRLLIRYITRLRDAEKAEGARNQSLMLVFCNKIKTVKYVHSFLLKNAQRASAIHGQMQQNRRDQALADFRSGKTPILVATDVAARGLHIKSLPLIINWDMAPSLAQYVHRCGRTGRQGHAARGRAYTLFTRNFAPMAAALIGLLETSGQKVSKELRDLAAEQAAGNVEAAESSSDEDEDGDGEAGAAQAADSSGDETSESGTGSGSEEE